MMSLASLYPVSKMRSIQKGRVHVQSSRPFLFLLDPTAQRPHQTLRLCTMLIVPHTVCLSQLAWCIAPAQLNQGPIGRLKIGLHMRRGGFPTSEHAESHAFCEVPVQSPLCDLLIDFLTLRMRIKRQSIPLKESDTWTTKRKYR